MQNKQQESKIEKIERLYGKDDSGESKELDTTEDCYLEYDEEGYLTCSFNHKAGDECLMNTPSK